MQKKLRQDLMDKRITDIVGNKIYYIHAPQSADLYVEYMFYNKKKSDFCSNKNLAYTHYIQVDIFSKGDFTNLEKAVEEVMEKKGYNFITSADLFEDDTKLYHKALRYTFKEMVKK